MGTSPIALVTGASGQDGTLLSAELRARGWEVVAVHAPGGRPATFPAVGDQVDVECDLADLGHARGLLTKYRPTHVFHLAAVSSVASSWADPVGTSHINGQLPVALMTECLELSKADRPIRFINASSGEIFAGADTTPQAEDTPVSPTSPYGAAKAFAFTMARALRSRGLEVSNAILFNHESPWRTQKFVTRKITSGVAAIVAGYSDRLVLGNLSACRDWGWAPDYVDAMIRMAIHPNHDDFVIATGQAYSVQEFVAEAFASVGITDWRRYVKTSSEFVRPADSATLVGDSSHAREILGWTPTKTFPDIVSAMVKHDLALIQTASQ